MAASQTPGGGNDAPRGISLTWAGQSLQGVEEEESPSLFTPRRVKKVKMAIPLKLITLDPTELGRVDPISLDQQQKERAERLGFDPKAKAPFSLRQRLKVRDSAGIKLKGRKKVASEEQQALVQKSLADKAEMKQPATPKAGAPAASRSVLDRFRK